MARREQQIEHLLRRAGFGGSPDEVDLYAELGRLAPDQIERVVFVTGGAFTPRAREFLERVPNARVEKPIDFQNLKLLLRNLRR